MLENKVVVSKQTSWGCQNPFQGQGHWKLWKKVFAAAKANQYAMYFIAACARIYWLISDKR